MDDANSSIFNYVEPTDVGVGNLAPHKQPPQRNVSRALAIAASIVIVLAGLKAASGLVGPVLLAMFIAVVLLIPLRWLQRNRCPVVLAYFVVLGSSIALFCLLTYFISTSLNDFIGKIPAYKDLFVQKLEQVEKKVEQFGFEIWKLPTDNKTETVATERQETESIATPEPEKPVIESVTQPSEKPVPIENAEDETTGDTVAADNTDEDANDGTEKKTASLFPLHSTLNEADLPTVKPEEVEQWVKNVQVDNNQSLISLDKQSVAAWLASIFLQLRHFLEGGFLVLIFSVFFLIEASQFSRKVDTAFGKNGAINNKHFHQIATDIRHYLVLKTISNIASGGAAMFVYYVFGVPAWFFWGIMAFFLYYIPNIGGTIAAIVPGILIFVNYDLPGVAMYAVCLVAIECTIAYGFEPRLLGHGLGLSTVVILLTLVFWGWILGPIGLFLAAPLTVMLKIILFAFPETQWAAIMLGDGKIASKE